MLKGAGEAATINETAMEEFNRRVKELGIDAQEISWGMDMTEVGTVFLKVMNAIMEAERQRQASHTAEINRNNDPSPPKPARLLGEIPL
jgi:phosphosulfolactate synthase (CoM biosynthesis protein A)